MPVTDKSWTTRIAASISMLLLAAAALVAAAPPAAAVSCVAWACNHYDPQTMGCSSGAKTLIAFNPEGAYEVHLRRSDACAAAWARLTNTATGYPRWRYLTLQVWDAPTGGRLLWKETRDVGYTQSGLDYWTAMASVQHWVQACMKNSVGDGPCSERR